MDLIIEHNRKKIFIEMLHIFDIYGINCNILIIRSIYEYNRVGLFKILLSGEYYPSGRNYIIDVVFEEGSADIVNFILSYKLYDLKHDLEEDLLYKIIEHYNYTLFELLIKRRHLHNADFSYNNNCLIKAAVINECTEIVKSLLDLPIECGIDVMAVENNMDLVQMSLHIDDIPVLELLLHRISKSEKDTKKFKTNYELNKYNDIMDYEFDEEIINFIEKTLNVKIFNKQL
jgi:hypothetical protein